MSEKILLVDGHSIINRAFYGVTDLTNSEGLHTNAVYGFLNIMTKVLEEEKPEYLAVAFDLHAPTFRHKMYDAYKGTRKPMPEELREQVPLMKEALQTMNIPILTMEGYEADDILGTVAKRCQAEGIEVSVVSGDRDLLQLADTHIKIRIPKTSKGSTQIYDYYPEDVKEQVNIELKYEGYIKRQLRQVEQYKKLENKKIPEDIDYDDVYSLRKEAVQKLKELRPASVGQASRISGVSPADISVLLIYLGK